jgi:hypothetical protein
MDPQACVARIREAIANRRKAEARDALSDLQEWVSNGGFVPGGASLEQLAIEVASIRQPAQLWEWEVTDTFGGEANYSWVERGTVKAATESGAIRAAKRAAGLCGRHRTTDFGDCLRCDMVGRCVVLFVTAGS